MWSNILCRQIVIWANPYRDSLSVTTYTDNQNLHDTVHNTKQTLAKRLIADISFLSEMIDQNELAKVAPIRYSHWRSTLYSDRFHDFPIIISTSYKDVYVICFFPHTARCCTSFSCNSMPHSGCPCMEWIPIKESPNCVHRKG